jgi:hypothetical protein
MIIKYVWYTSRYNKRERETHTRCWRGWFLFGFIPLYIETTKLTIE